MPLLKRPFRRVLYKDGQTMHLHSYVYRFMKTHKNNPYKSKYEYIKHT